MTTQASGVAKQCPHCGKTSGCEHVVYSGKEDIVKVLMAKYAPKFDIAKFDSVETRTMWENEFNKWLIPGEGGVWYSRLPDADDNEKRLKITVQVQAMFQRPPQGS